MYPELCSVVNVEGEIGQYFGGISTFDAFALKFRSARVNFNTVSLLFEIFCINIVVSHYFDTTIVYPRHDHMLS